MPLEAGSVHSTAESIFKNRARQATKNSIITTTLCLTGSGGGGRVWADVIDGGEGGG